MACSFPPRAALAIAVLAITALGIAGCSGPEPPPRPSFVEAESHGHYAAGLVEFGLDKAALGREWLQAADHALAQPVTITLPFHESGYLPPSTPAALGYRFELRRGRVLRIDVEFDGPPDTRLFIQLFEIQEGREPRRVAEAEGAVRHIEYEAGRDGMHVLRIQPELLRGGRVTVVERTMASLGFPVEGLSLRAIQSVFGDPRDGGARDHHGVDIFAPRGTPVVAAVDGTVRVDTGNRGGQLIWLYAGQSSSEGQSRRRRGRRLYYAHLDGWAVENGDTVRAGDVIGYVGNTGNARTTPPHLHFGVYDRGPLDPVPFLQPDDPDPGVPSGTLDLLDGWARVLRNGTSLLDAPSRRAAVLGDAGRHDLLRVAGLAGGYYRVRMRSGSAAYVRVTDVTPATDAVATEAVAGNVPFRDAPDHRGSIIDTLVATTSIEVLGHAGDYRLVRLSDARVGWVAAPVAPPGL